MGFLYRVYSPKPMLWLPLLTISLISIPFGGNPVSMAAAQVVLKVIEEEQLQAHAKYVGGLLEVELKTHAQA